MAEVLKETLMSLVYLGVITLVPFLMYALKQGSSVLIDYLRTKTDNDIMNQVLSEIVTFTEDAVTFTMQTYVDTLKKEGKFDKDAQEIAFEKAVDTALQFISEESVEMFESVYGNIEDYLEVLVEAKVKEIKASYSEK